MILVMQPGASADQVDAAVQKVKDMGLEPHVLVGTERTVIALIGDERSAQKASLEVLPGVDSAMPVVEPYKLAARSGQPDPSVVSRGSFTCGGGTLGMIAGPCSVESQEQILSTARSVKAAGATALRGGAFKPRTSPYSFQGHKAAGLEMLAAAREETGLAIVTEVVANEDVDLVATHADVLQVGARNMQNYRLLAARRRDRPSRYCSNAARPRRWMSSCWPPSTSCGPAIRR